MKWNNLLRAWPDHFDKAIRTLNWRILPALKFCPKEILLGLVVNTKPTPIEESASLIMPVEIDAHMAYAVQQRLDSYNEAIQHATKCKMVFDRKVMKKGGAITFEKGQLVQAYRSNLANSLSTSQKIEPMLLGDEPSKSRPTLF